MSMYPPGVTTALVTAGTAIDFAGSPARTISVKVTPILGGTAKSITHEATGGDMGISVLSYSSDDTGVVSFELPHTDQPGWVDGMQRAVPGWAYKADITINLPGGTLNKTKNFTVPSGQEHVDLDRIADGQVILGVNAPAEVVSSVAGLTGAISRDALAEALGTISGGGGEGGAYDDAELRQRVEDLEDRPNPDFSQFVQQAALSSLYTAGEGAALEIRVSDLEDRPTGEGGAYDDRDLVARVVALEQAPAPDLSGYVTTAALEDGLAGKSDVDHAHPDLEQRVTDLAQEVSGGSLGGFNTSDIEVSVDSRGRITLLAPGTTRILAHRWVPDTWAPTGPRVGIMGDSHSDVQTMYSPGQSWWQRALPESGALFVPGRWTAEARAGWSLHTMVTDGSGTDGVSLLDASLARDLDVLVVMAGGNDAVQSTTAQFKADLIGLSSRARAAGTSVVFVFAPPMFEAAPYGPDVQERYAAMRQLAREGAELHDYAFFDVWDEYDHLPAEWAQDDATHLNLAGHYALGGLVAPFLRDTLVPAPLGTSAWVAQGGSSEVYEGATVTEVSAPESWASSTAHQMLAPAGGYAARQTNLGEVPQGETIDLAMRVNMEPTSASSGGFQLAVIDMESWSPVTVSGQLRWEEGLSGVASLSWTADRVYSALRVAAVIEGNDAEVKVTVGDALLTRTAG